MDEIRRHAKMLAEDIHPLRAAAVRALAAHPNGREWFDWVDEVKERTRGVTIDSDDATRPGWIKVGGDPLFEMHPIDRSEYWSLTVLGRAVYAILTEHGSKQAQSEKGSTDG